MRRHHSTEQYAVYKQEAAEEWWGQVRCRTEFALQRLLEDDSEQQMADYLRLAPYERSGESQERVDSRNGFYKRDCVTALGVIRLRIRRTRKRSFLPRGLTAPQRRAPEVAEMIRQAFLRGISTRAVGRDGAAGLAAALETVYPRARHQRCWVHKMRNLRDGVRRRDQAAIKRGAQRIYLARNARQARGAFQRFRFHWRALYPGLVKRLERDLPDLLTFFDFPQPLWRKLRTTNVIERCFVQVRRRTRPMVLFVNVASVERIIYAIFHRFNQQWQNHTLNLFTQAA
jgi:transposase-like protein